jgi:Na+(H+)/acetate symporter ActP
MTTSTSSLIAIGLTIAVTIGLAAYSTRLARTTGDFYVASRSVPPWWNASAISGEYLSAASFLGVAGLIMAGGADALWFPVGYAVGYVLLLALVAAPLRRSGAYTIPDFAEIRLPSRAVRFTASVLVVGIGWLYVVPQLQGAGRALQVVAGVPSWVGGLAVAVTVLVVLLGGGMRSVTLVQGFQYWLKLVAIAVPVLFLLAAWNIDRQPTALSATTPTFREATTVEFPQQVTVVVPEQVTVTGKGTVNDSPVDGTFTLTPGQYDVAANTTLAFPQGAQVPTAESIASIQGDQWGYPLQGAAEHPMYRTYALMFALFLGTMGLPHVLVRFYTNPDGRAARRTAAVVIGLVGLFYLMPSIYGVLGRIYTPELLMTGDTDAVVLLLPSAVVGGTIGVLLSALIAAGAAAAFLATATGLTVSVAGVLSQDVIGRWIKRPLLSFRLAAVAAVVAPLALGVLAADLPLARAVALAFTVAASTFSPLLILGIWWRRLTDVGAVAGLTVGGTLSIFAISVSTFNTELSGWPAALLSQPAAWTMPAALLTMIGVSLFTVGRIPRDVNRIMVRLHTPESVPVDRGATLRRSR